MTFGKPIFSRTDIQKRVKELGDQISEDYKSDNLLVVGVMKGAFVFLADLVRAIRIPITVDYLGISSFADRSRGRGAVRISSDLNVNIAGKNVLVVEDIVNSGLTMKYITETLNAREPQSVRVCTLLDKVEKRRTAFTPDYVGFTIPDQYVIGYGLDYQDQYRNLPYIARLVEE